MSKFKQTDFIDQTIYVGIDVHKKQWTVCILFGQYNIKKFSQPPCAQTLINYLKKHYPNGTYESVYEAGFCGFGIHDSLLAGGVKNIVVNAADVPTSDKDRQQKTDTRDAKKLAQMLKGGGLEGIYIPTLVQREARGLVRYRSSIVKDMTRIKNRIKGALHFHGVLIPVRFDKCNWSNHFLNWLSKEVQFHSLWGDFILKGLISQLRSLRVHLLSVTRSIRALSKSTPYKESAKNLNSIPGIGLISAMTILTELFCLERFGNLKSLAAYVGFIPSTHSSGEHDRTGRMTYRGNKRLKKILIEASWVAIRHDPALALKYEELTQRMKGSKAIVRIARKLLNRIRCVLKNQTEYVLNVSGK